MIHKQPGDSPHGEQLDPFFLIENLPLPFAYLDRAGRLRQLNRAAEELFGHERQQLTDKALSELIEIEHRAAAVESFLRALSGLQQHFISVLRLASGALCQVEISYTPARVSSGEVAGVICIVREDSDVPSRDRTHARLAPLTDSGQEAFPTTEQYRQAVLDAMPECVKVLDHHGNVLHMNPAGLRMLEADEPGQVLGTCVYPLIKEDHRELFRTINQSVFEGGYGGQLEFAICGLKGAERILESHVAALRGAAGEVIGALSVTRDITNRASAELRDAFLVRLDNESRALSDPAEIAVMAARLLCEHLHADRCSYAEISVENDRVDVVGNYSPQLPSVIGRYSLRSFGSEFLARMSAGQPHVFQHRSELGVEAALAYEAMGIAAIVAIPILKHGRLVAGLGVHQATPRRWRADEIELIRIVANRCWESVERGRVERELRASEEQFRTLADAIPNLAWIAHSDGNLFWYNRRWYDYTGTSPESMEGWGWQSVHDPAELPRVMDGWKKSLASGKPFEMVFPLRSARGDFRSFLTRVEPIKDNEGRVLRWFGTNTDITAQQESERREKKSRQTAELLNRVGPLLSAELDEDKLTQKITDIATEAVGAEFGAFFHNVVDESGECCILHALAGVDRERLAGFPMPQRTPVFPGTFNGQNVIRSNDIENDTLDGKNAPHPAILFEHFPIRSYLAVPVRSRSGMVFGGLFFGHARPNTFTEEAESIAAGIAAQAAIALDNALLFKETKRSAEALREINEDLTRVNEDLNQFAYSASHDLREPLRMVSIYTQLLSRSLGNKLSDTEVQYVEYIRKGATRMEALVHDLLSYTQSTKRTEEDLPVADANEALNRALMSLSAAVDETGARITSTALPAVRIAEVHLAQLFQNLIGNALKYRRDEIPEIQITSRRQSEEWLFSVADNGIGIEAPYREQIFGIFKRLHADDEYSGTGIGLAICQRIVQHAGGRIWVDSEPGGGSTFFFTLPPAD